MQGPVDIGRGLTAEILRKRLRYEPNTGDFYWLYSPRTGVIGKKAGYARKDGYIVINIDGEIYLAHRLAWLHSYGEWPISGIDHINGNPNYNAITNLRQADPNENHWNMKIFSTNTSGCRGVTFHRKTGKWVASLSLRQHCGFVLTSGLIF